MKLTINTEAKKISIEGEVNLNELYKFLDDTFKDHSWKEYKLESGKTEYIQYPIYPNPQPYYPIINPWYSQTPWEQNEVWCGNTNTYISNYPNITQLITYSA